MLTIEIVSDIVCPWCFVGKRRLEVAVATVRREIPDFSCQKRWRPFFLNPDVQPEGEPFLPFLEHKFGGRTRVDALFEHIRSTGRASGIDFAFEKIDLRANTLQAHRLIHCCLLYTSDAADERSSVDLGGRRIINKKNKKDKKKKKLKKKKQTATAHYTTRDVGHN